MVTRNCLQCNSSFTTCNYLRDKQKFCSRKCKAEWQKTSFLGKNNPFYGKKIPEDKKLYGEKNPMFGRVGKLNPFYGKRHTKETKEKMSQAKIGRTAWNKGLKGYGAGKNHPMKRPEVALKSKMNRKKMSEEARLRMSARMKLHNPVKRKEVREKISKTLTGRSTGRNGSKCNFWRGGLSDVNKTIKQSIEYKNFVRKVYQRDGYRCRMCGLNSGKLNVHHIKNFATNKKLRTITSNGVTLCLKCHRDFHKKYGFKNNTIKQVKEFLLVNNL